MNKTDWYEDGCYPVRHGVYERDIMGTMLFSYWNGYDWYTLARTPYRAVVHYGGGIISSYQQVDRDHRWRGILQ